jgi:hypothetical protein
MQKVIRNEDILFLTAEIPEGHRHLRTTLVLRDGSELVFQEAATAALARAYVGIKTHPLKTRIAMRGVGITERKEGFAEWQLLEE